MSSRLMWRKEKLSNSRLARGEVGVEGRKARVMRKRR